MKMKIFRIVNEVTGAVCTDVSAGYERSALKKYMTGMTSSGIYEIVKREDGRPRLVTSYGACFRADRV